MQKAKFTVTIVIAVLLLSIATPLIQFSGSTAQADPNSTNIGVVQHKMSPSELQDYKDSAGTYEQNQNSTDQASGYGTGLHSPTNSKWVDISENAYVVDKISYQTTLPAAVDHTADPWFPPIGNQGSQGSCASFAVGYYCKTYQEAKEHQWDLSGAQWTGGADNCNISSGYQSEVMSPAFVYNLINGGRDVGSDFETPIRLVSNVGICSWASMPYYWQDCIRWPTEAAWNEAPLYRSNSTYSYQYIYANTSQGVENVKNWLAAGNLAIVAIDATDNLWNYTTHSIALNSQDLFTSDNYCVGNLDHAATIVGYDDLYTYVENGVVQHGAFKIANSWGVGRWENIPDGCYWISYAAMEKMSTPDNPVEIFKNQDNYQPEILTTFNISHAATGDCNITFGLGTPEAPIAIKNFTDFVYGGNRPFSSNNVVFDLTEFKANLTSLYNQPFFMQVYDAGTGDHGTANTGTVNSFAIADTSSLQAPISTVNDHYVNLTLITSFAPTTLSVSPTSGPASGQVTLTGTGLRGTSVDISYYNPVTLQWIPITTNYAVSTNFTYTFYAPDLQQCNLAGDNAPASDSIVFRVQDSGTAYTASLVEWRRGLMQVGNQTASGLFGNSTDLSAKVFVQNGQLMVVSGKWFSSGIATLLWDSVNIGTSVIDQTGFFNATVTVPASGAGQHTLTVSDGSSNVSATVTRMPTLTNNYTDVWHTQDFAVNLTSDYPMTETYYRINNGQTCTLSANGQPIITTEGAANTLEYWSTWNVYGTGSMELNHTTLTGIKLDKTAPTATLQINNGASTTTANSVTLTISSADSTSGIKQVRFSSDGSWTQAAWEPYAATRSWQLSSGLGAKTVYCQIQDNAGQTTTVSASITLSAPQATATPTPTATQTPQAPEYSTQLFIVLLALLTVSLVAASKIRKTKS